MLDPSWRSGDENDRRVEAFSALGAGLVSDLLVKPNVMTYDRCQNWAMEPAGRRVRAIGVVGRRHGACLLSAGAESANFLHYLRVPPGHIFEFPRVGSRNNGGTDFWQ